MGGKLADHRSGNLVPRLAQCIEERGDHVLLDSEARHLLPVSCCCHRQPDRVRCRANPARSSLSTRRLRRLPPHFAPLSDSAAQEQPDPPPRPLPWPLPWPPPCP